ncbi:MAG: aminotransferase class I/II-fold pyridoxal phosphate-dependent enzyme [Bacteroidota bacterium]
MSALAHEHQAINLSQGYPGFEPDPTLLKKVSKAMKSGANQYAPMAGNLQLRKEVNQTFERRDSVSFNPESEITITAGATQAIFTAIQALLKEEDEVILFSPAYDCYAPAIELTGATIVNITLPHPSYEVPWEEVQKVMNRKTKMIVVNTPHNPTGAIWRQSDWDRLAQPSSEDPNISTIPAALTCSR